jgi:hypothetical protein
MRVIDIMSWINSRQFTISNRNGRHYVFRRSNAGNTEINIPKTIITKGQAVAWLKAHPEKVAAPNRFRPKKGPAVPGLKPFEVMKNGKKMVKFINKAGKEYLLAAPANEPNYFVNSNAAKGKYTPWKFTCAGLARTLKQRKVIGKGRQGIVFLASRYTNGRYPFAIKVAPRDLRAERSSEKQPSKVEFTIHKAAQEAAPDGVVGVHQILECPNFVKPAEIDMKNVQSAANYDKSKQTIILMEYCPEGSLKSWMDKSVPSDSGLRSVIARIIDTLVKIKAVHPHFNHNDLHLENIFMSARGPLIGDFGWARLEKNGTNPAVNKASGTQTANLWGVGPKTDTRYDHHLILNEIREWALKHGGAAKYPQTMTFLNMAVPMGYRGAKDTHISEWRLKYGDPCTDLPSLTKIAHVPYVKGQKLVTSPNLAAARLRLKKVGAPKRLVTSANLRAAKARLRKVGVKKTFTNAELVAMTAANFLKLSPSTRARAQAVRAAAKGKGKAVMNIKKPVAGKAGPVVPAKGRKPLPPAILKSNKFNKMVTKIWTNQGAVAGVGFNNAWNKARKVAINRIQNRIAGNMAPFTPTPPKPKEKTPSPPKPPKAKTPSPPKPPKAKTPSPPKAEPKARPNYRLSPSSGRAKIQSKNTGRWVYANLQSMEYLKGIAALMNVNLKGLRSKANIAKKLFG